MEEETQLEGNSDRGKIDEIFPWEEWTVIEDNDDPVNCKVPQENLNDDVSLSYDNVSNTSDAEEAHESIKASSEQTLDICLSDSVIRRSEESDGVSVISESENEEPNVSNEGSKIILYKAASVRSEENKRMNTNKEVTSCVYLLIACSMIITIGIGFGSRSYVANNNSKDLDYVTIKMENDKLLERMKEFSSVKGILEEIKSSMVQKRNADPTDMQDSTTDGIKELEKLYMNEHINRLDLAINKPEIAFPERLQIFLRTICLILEDIRQTEKPKNQRSICESRSFFTNLEDLRTLLNTVIEEMDDSTKSSNQRFLESVDLQLSSMSEKLVLDLTKTLEKLSKNNERKMEKIVYKMNERLCVLRNTLPSESKARQSLEINETFVKNCDKIVRKKFDRRKEKWRKEKQVISEPTIFEKKNSKNLRPNFVVGSIMKEKNSTKTHDRLKDRDENVWNTIKCNRRDTKSFERESKENVDDTCSILRAPPRSSTWKPTKRETFATLPMPMKEFMNDEASEKIIKKKSHNIRSKGDRVDTKHMKKKTEFEKSKNRKRSFSSNEKDNDYKKNVSSKMGSYSSPIESWKENSEEKYKRVDSIESTAQKRRAKKRFDKTTMNELDGTKSEKNIRSDGQWQFTRSRIRDELRKEKSNENWYFDRMSNRKNSRININNIENHL